MNQFLSGRLFDRTIHFLEQSLNLRGARQGILSNNIANAETPDYSAKDLPFQKIMRQKMGESSASTVPVQKTHPLHFPDPGSAPGKESGLPWSVETDSSGVTIDQEMTKLAENNLQYQSAVQALTKKLETIKYVISDGGR
jgi:flagellar basal-body rod protein FlgB